MKSPSVFNHSSPHVQANTDVAKVMLQVLLALLPGLLVIFWFFGWGIWIHLGLACMTAIACEALVLKLRGKDVMLYLKDYSAVVTAVLLVIAIPTVAPWWITVFGVSFAIIIAKQLYGGLGYNPFNPAMVGYVALLISFPLQMTIWLSPFTEFGFVESVNIIFWGFDAHLSVDALTTATPLDELKTRLALAETVSEIKMSGIFGAIAGIGWEWVNLAFLGGGLYLIYQKVISWHIPVAVLSGLFITALLFYLIAPDYYLSPILHLFSGGTMLAAFFIATDPVSSSTTPKGRLIYGVSIGVLIYMIRTWGGYPDGVAFSVLLVNMAVPTIDYYTRPQVFGYQKLDDTKEE